MASWYGIEGIKHIPDTGEIEYMGNRFGEWEITNVLQAELEEDIREGNFLPKSMTFEDKVFEEYIKWRIERRGADSIYGLWEIMNALQEELKEDIREGNFSPEGTFEDKVFEEYVKWRGADSIYSLLDNINDAIFESKKDKQIVAERE